MTKHPGPCIEDRFRFGANASRLRTHYQYNGDGTIRTTEMDNGADGVVDHRVEYERDDQGNPTSIETTTLLKEKPQSITRRFRYEYDEQGRTLVSEEYEGDGKGTVRRVSNTYNEHGDVTRSATDQRPIDGRPDKITTHSYTYDDRGNKLSDKAVLHQQGTKGMSELLTDLTFRYDSRGNMIAREMRSPSLGLSEQHALTYDPHGNLVAEEIDKGLDGTIDSRVTYTSDEKGNPLVIETDEDADGTADSRLVFEYSCWN